MSDRKTAIIAGAFFILATMAGVTVAVILGPLLGAEAPLQALAANAGMVRLATLLDIIMAGAVIAIAVVLYPVLARAHKALAAGYLVARTVEGLLLALGGMAWIGLLSATEAQAGLLMERSTALFSLGAEITFGVTALILNTMLWQARLVPRWLSGWGFIGGGLILALGVLKLLGLPYASAEAALTAPIALNEMVLALWLIIKGFSRTTSGQ
jgi:hypothetical protein